MGYIIHYYLLANLKEQVTASNEQKLVQMKDIMDTKLSELHKISMQVSSQHELTPYFVNNFFDVYKAKKLLNYKVGNDFIYEIFYYIRGDQFLFSGGSSYMLAPFINSYYQFPNWSYDDFYKDMNERHHPFLRNAEEVSIFNGRSINIITYGVPVPFNNTEPYGTLMFFIKEQAIKDMLKNVISSNQGNAFILDQHGGIVTKLFNRDSELTSITNEFKLKKLQDEQTVKIDNKVYYLSSIKSDFLDWTFITISPESEVMKDVNSVRNKVMISYAFVLGAGILLIYLGMHINYKPLRKLIRKAEEKWSHFGQKNNALDNVWEAINYFESRNQLLSKRVEKNRPVLQQYLLIRLLRGEITDYEEFNLLGADIDITFEEPCHYVMLLDFYKERLQDAEKRDQLIDGWLEKIPAVESYRVNLLETSKIAIILSGDVKTTFLDNWYQHIIKNKAFPVTIGIGNSYHEITQIGKSYLEAATALDYKLIKGADQIIYFTEIFEVKTNIHWYEREIVAELEMSLRQRQRENAVVIMNKLTQSIKSPDTTLFMAKCLMYDVTSTVMRIVHDIQTIRAKMNEAFPDVLVINDFQSVGEMEETVNKMIDVFFALYEENESENQLLENILSFMEDNYSDYQFSIQTLADHFSLSEAYIMRYFKKQTGETILQHLNRIRMNQTKEMLTNTDLPVKDIAMQVGYSDVSSFIRKFKQMEKLTPGEYRKQFSNKNAK
nr:helix-turn-helix domain-containing protein [Lederbergia citrisecunda]